MSSPIVINKFTIPPQANTGSSGTLKHAVAHELFDEGLIGTPEEKALFKKSWAKLESQQRRKMLQELGAALEVLQAQPSAPTFQTDKLSTREVVDAFLKSTEPGLKPRSFESYTKELKRFARNFEYLPNIPEPIEEYMKRGVKGKEYAPARRAYIRSVLNSLYEFVIARRQPDFPQVMRTIKVRKVKHDGGSNLKWDELSRVMDMATDSRDIAMLHLGIGQGFRPCEEMVRLNVEDILEDRIYIRGKERDEWAPLLPEVRDSLKALMNGKGEKEPVFISQMKRRLSADMAALRIKALFKKAEIRGTNRQRPYILRHTFATLTRAAGCDKASVDALMRHRTEDVSAFYDHRSDEEKLQLLKAKLEQYSPLRRLNGHQAPNSNKSDIPQNFLGSLRLGYMINGIKP